VGVIKEISGTPCRGASRDVGVVRQSIALHGFQLVIGIASAMCRLPMDA
jgi:hypothetical protein